MFGDEAAPKCHPKFHEGAELLRGGWYIRDICKRLKVAPNTVIKWKGML
jgi:transposase-like protein